MSKKVIGIIIGVLVGLGVLTVGALALLSPVVGSSFNDVAALEGGEVGYAPQAADEADFVAEEPASDGAVGSSTGNVNRANAQVQERLIIRTGSIRITSDDTVATRETIENIVEQYSAQGAFIVTVDQSGGAGDERPTITMQIRVPSEAFGPVMDEIADSGVDVLARSQSAEDVTEEYVDVQSRLEALEAARERLLELLDEAETTEALLEAERQLTQREQEINALRGRLQFLEESAALSLISVSISPTRTSQPIDTRWRPGETFREAVDRLLESLRNFVDFVIIFSISVLPWLLVFGAVAYGVIRAVTWAIRRFTSRGNDTS